MRIGYDPKNIKGTEEIIKKKNEETTALKKQLKLPPTKHPQAKEFLENEGQKDEMMNLIIQLKAQLKEWRMRWTNWCRKRRSTWKQLLSLSFLQLLQ